MCLCDMCAVPAHRVLSEDQKKQLLKRYSHPLQPHLLQPPTNLICPYLICPTLTLPRAACCKLGVVCCVIACRVLSYENMALNEWRVRAIAAAHPGMTGRRSAIVSHISARTDLPTRATSAVSMWRTGAVW